jgi:hypothetical protein
VRNEIEKENNAAYTEEIEKLVQSLAEKNKIVNATLESHLDEPEVWIDRDTYNQRLSNRDLNNRNPRQSHSSKGLQEHD